MCCQVVRDLVNCHDQNPYKKFFGACNDAKRALDECFKREKQERYKANLAKARESAEKLAEVQRERQAMESTSDAG